MAKKTTLSLRAERKDLLWNCGALISRFRVTSDYLRVGLAATAAMESQTSTMVVAGASSQTLNMPSLSLGPPEMLSLIQAAMVQEWQVYLDAVFEAVVMQLLTIRDYSRVPSQMIDITDIDANSLVQMRRSIAIAAREEFSFRPYDKRVQMVLTVPLP